MTAAANMASRASIMPHTVPKGGAFRERLDIADSQHVLCKVQRSREPELGNSGPLLYHGLIAGHGSSRSRLRRRGSG